MTDERWSCLLIRSIYDDKLVLITLKKLFQIELLIQFEESNKLNFIRDFISCFFCHHTLSVYLERGPTRVPCLKRPIKNLPKSILHQLGEKLNQGTVRFKELLLWPKMQKNNALIQISIKLVISILQIFLPKPKVQSLESFVHTIQNLILWNFEEICATKNYNRISKNWQIIDSFISFLIVS